MVSIYSESEDTIQHVRENIIHICKDLYDSCDDDDSYFIANGKNSYDVKQDILSRILPEYAKDHLLNMVAYILDINGDTFINIA